MDYLVPLAIPALIGLPAVALFSSPFINLLIKPHDDKKAINWSILPSWCTYKAMMGLYGFVNKLQSTIEPPPMRIMNIVMGVHQSAAIYAACELRIAEVLAKNGPMTKDELAHAVDADPARLERLMGLLMSISVFSTDGARYFNNHHSAVLREDHINSVKALVGHMFEDSYESIRYLSTTVRNGSVVVFEDKKIKGGRDFWTYLNEEKAQGEQFNRAMTAMNTIMAPALVADGQFKDKNRILDIAGGRGHLLARILESYGHLQGLVFDQPSVIQGSTKKAWAGDGEYAALASRVELVQGSFFDATTLPKAQEGDMYIMRMILHDWKDDDAIAILKNLRAVIGNTPKVLVSLIEIVLPDQSHKSPLPYPYIADQHMAVCLGAKERDAAEWTKLFVAAGFKPPTFTPTRSSYHFVTSSVDLLK